MKTKQACTAQGRGRAKVQKKRQRGNERQDIYDPKAVEEGNGRHRREGTGKDMKQWRKVREVVSPGWVGLGFLASFCNFEARTMKIKLSHEMWGLEQPKKGGCNRLQPLM